jgi:hypothetical protein
MISARQQLPAMVSSSVYDAWATIQTTNMNQNFGHALDLAMPKNWWGKFGLKPNIPLVGPQPRVSLFEEVLHIHIELRDSHIHNRLRTDLIEHRCALADHEQNEE